MTRPYVSNTAVLRFLQLHGVDIEYIRKEIAQTCKRGVERDAPSIRIEDVRFINADGRIITTMSSKARLHYNFLVRVQRGER